MAVTLDGSGTQTAVISTEHVLDTVATAGSFTFHVDTVNMAAGDVLELRAYQKVLTGGVMRVAYMQRYSDAQPTDDLIKISVPISNDLVEAASMKFTLLQVAGTGRVYVWKALKYS